MFKKRKKNSKLFLVIFIIFFGVVYSNFYSIFSEKGSNYNQKNDNSKVLDTISKTLELNTVKYNYSNLVTVKKDKTINNIKLPFTEKSFIIKYEGVINGGVRSDNVKILINEEDTIKLEISECSILEHYIKDDGIYVYNTKESIFNKIEIQEVLDDISKYKNEYEKKVLEEGFLKEVESSVKDNLTSILTSLGYKNIEIVFLSNSLN